MRTKLIVGDETFRIDAENQKFFSNGKDGCIQIQVTYKSNNGWNGYDMFPSLYLQIQSNI